MKHSELNIASISDIHLGHPKTPTVEILKNLRKAFPDNEETGKLDIIWFGGDVFDQSLSVHDPNVTEIQLWIHQFLRMCKKRDIVVRVLEGTPSHDWRQSNLFEEANVNAHIDADLKYVDTLSIEYIERFDIHVLYVPDEWTPETDDTWRQTVQLLKSHNLEKVDYAIMHGSFTYQLPSHVKVPMHIPERYLGIVKHYIFVGHIHKHSQYERILANGSFDRLSHGEEESKGHWRVKVGGKTGDELVFVKTKGAKVYRTIDCTSLSVEEALKSLEQVKDLPAGSHVRVASAKNDPILTSLDLLRKQYPNLQWTSKVTETNAVQANLLVDLRNTFEQINITPSNITELLMKRIREMTNDEQVISRCTQRLSEII